jgi:DNA-binding MarR family transcriptional regulator
MAVLESVYIHGMAERLRPGAIAEMDGCVCLALRRTARTLTRFYDRALRRHRLRATQLPILAAACTQEAVPLAAVAEALGMERTTLLRNVRPLVRRRLVSVDTPADSRRTEIRATPAGRALVARAYPEWRRAQATALKTLREGDWVRGLAALEAVARGAK